MKKELSPCCVCTRVADPENCVDKTCRTWQAWFLEQWKQTQLALRGIKDMPASQVGVPLGGRTYAPPHETRAYLRADPCGTCRVPGSLCHSPCRKRLVWEDLQ